jgi:hypothetical protein
MAQEWGAEREGTIGMACAVDYLIRMAQLGIFKLKKILNYHTSGKPEKYLTRLAGLFPAYSENKPVKNGDHGIKPY